MKLKLMAFLWCLLAVLPLAIAVESDEADADAVEITSEMRQQAGIETSRIQLHSLPIYVTAPAEVVLNADLSTIITPRIEAQVVKRLVQAGDYVELGQALVVLSSVTMMDAQSEFLLAAQEWKLVKQLGKQAVAAKRYQGAEIAYQQAYARLRAYGMLSEQITELLTLNDPDNIIGNFTLLAPRAGRIYGADFIEGEMIVEGTQLFQVVDESSLWVDAKLPNEAAADVEPGNVVAIDIDGQRLEGVVLQKHHQLDEITRTEIIRIEVPDPEDLLHPGEFINVHIKVGVTESVLALPQTAVLPVDNNWVIYVAVTPDHFQQVQVTAIEVIDNMMVIEGVEAGTEVVTEGAFFVHSELLKGEFDAHGH